MSVIMVFEAEGNKSFLFPESFTVISLCGLVLHK